MACCSSTLWGMSRAIAVLFFGSCWQLLGAERPSAFNPRPAALLELHPRGSVIGRGKQRSAGHLASVAVQAATSRPLHHGNSSYDPLPKNWFPAVDEWLRNHDAAVDKVVDKMKGSLNEAGQKAIQASKDYTEMPVQLQQGIYDMQNKVTKLRKETKAWHNEQIEDMKATLIDKAAKTPYAVPFVKDSFPVPRPGKPIQIGDDWTEPPDLEALQEQNRRLQDQLAEVMASEAYHKGLAESEREKRFTVDRDTAEKRQDMAEENLHDVVHLLAEKEHNSKVANTSQSETQALDSPVPSGLGGQDSELSGLGGQDSELSGQDNGLGTQSSDVDNSLNDLDSQELPPLN